MTFRPGRPLLTKHTQDQLKQLARDGFATVEAMSDPPQIVTVVRRNPDTYELEDMPPVEAVVRHDNLQAAVTGVGLSTAVADVTGTIRREAPWDIQVGDRVRLGDGSALIIVAPRPYERFGVIRARWKQEQGTP